MARSPEQTVKAGGVIKFGEVVARIHRIRIRPDGRKEVVYKYYGPPELIKQLTGKRKK